MEGYALWLLDNIDRIGIVTGSIVVAVGLVWALAKEYVVLGAYHRREIKAGDEALELLPTVNEKLAEMRILAAEQRIRDEYGRRDMDELRRRLEQCATDLNHCTEMRERSPRTDNRRRA